MVDIKDYTITILLCEGDFEQSIGRLPKNQEEFDKWARWVKKGLLNGHINWGILWECACDAMADYQIK